MSNLLDLKIEDSITAEQFEKNPVILEFEAFQRFFTFESKQNYGSKKTEKNKILVKVEYNI